MPRKKKIQSEQQSEETKICKNTSIRKHRHLQESDSTKKPITAPIRESGRSACLTEKAAEHALPCRKKRRKQTDGQPSDSTPQKIATADLSIRLKLPYQKLTSLRTLNDNAGCNHWFSVNISANTLRYIADAREFIKNHPDFVLTSKVSDISFRHNKGTTITDKAGENVKAKDCDTYIRVKKDHIGIFLAYKKDTPQFQAAYWDITEHYNEN